MNRDFKAQKPKEKMATDITYIETKEGWLYLSAIIDLFNNEIVSYEMSNRCDTNLTLKTLNKAADLKGVMLQTDRGSTYTAKSYMEQLAEKGVEHSMSRAGKCLDNACIETFWGSLKCDTLYHASLKEGLWSYKEAEKKIKEYMRYYNEEREQAKFKYMSPKEYKKHKGF